MADFVGVNATAAHALTRIQSRRIMCNGTAYVVAQLPGSCSTGHRNCLASHFLTIARSGGVDLGAISLENER